jgi:hypothetical protein
MKILAIDLIERLHCRGLRRPVRRRTFAKDHRQSRALDYLFSGPSRATRRRA